MICSENEDKWRELSVLAEVLFRRGYNKHLIRSGFLKALLLERSHLLEDNQKSSTESSPKFFVTKFLEGFDWSKLRSDVQFLKKRTGLTHQICFAFRVDRNLRSFLVHSGRARNGKKECKGVSSLCARKNCPICKDGGSFRTGKFDLEGHQVSLTEKCGCKISSVVYLLMCEQCKLGYVGATSRELSKRFSEHLGKIKGSVNEIQTVHLHFKNSKDSCKPSIGVLEVVNDPEKLLETEKWFIKKLRPHFNVRDATYVKSEQGYKQKVG